MASSGNASNYFHHVAAWQVIVCKECCYAVWPDEVQGHLHGKKHRIPKKEARAIAKEVEEWPGVARYNGESELPHRIHEPIPELPLYTDGWKCQLGRDPCQYICRDKKTIKTHWQAQHQWSTRSKPGKPEASEAGNASKRFQQGATKVDCQRFFRTRCGSHYLEVRRPEDATTAQIHATSSERAWEKAWSRANDYWDSMQEEVNSKIHKGAADEVSPWLKRTGWIEYLEGCDRDDLLESIREPKIAEDDDHDDRRDEEIKAVEIAIWQAMAEVAEISQTTVTQSGVMLRLEAIRTEMHQTRYQPLQPYQDASRINRRCRPWQQMLMFFVRTQRRHEWQSPPYRFSRRQFAAFEKLIEAAEEIGRNGYSEEESEGESEDEGDHANRGEVESPPDRPTPTSSHSEPLTTIQEACLTFCIELLNPKIHNKECDMALICASAVLGMQPHGGGF